MQNETNHLSIDLTKKGYDPKWKLFNQFWGHFESPESKRRILNLISATNLIEKLVQVRLQ
jgi:hypothetical protein